ncbi:MAG: helix-turn-helix transcriptional regulator [Pseudomonadota bacterium]
MRHITELDIYINEKVKHYRKSCGFTQEELASYLGVSFQQIQKYENSINRISASKLHIIARTLEIPIEDFLPNE